MNKLKMLIMATLTFIILSVTIATISSAQDEYEYYWDTWSEEEAFFMGLGLTMCIMIVIIPLVIAILACIWIYKDAEKRGKSGGLWVLILILASLFLSFLGLIIVIIVWLVIRPPIGGEPKQVSTTERRCPNCGRGIPMDAKACPYCAKKFEE